MKYIRLLYAIIGMVVISLTAKATYSIFADRGNVLGTSFSVGSADLKLLTDVTLPAEDQNLVDDLAGPTFENISENWYEDHLMKIYNNGSTRVQLSSHADYDTANDPEELRQLIYIEMFEWNDDGNGIVDPGEDGDSYGRKTIVKWKTEGIELGEMETGEI